MVRKQFTKKEYIVLGVIVALFLTVSFSSFLSIKRLQGNARVVNYVGIVRGATQKLVKKELRGYPDEALAERLDSIVNELLEGHGQHGLSVLPDQAYLANMRQVRGKWAEIKKEIAHFRQGEDDGDHLYDLSEAYFDLVDRTVFSAEAFSEKSVKRSVNMLTGVNIVFVLILLWGIVGYFRSVSLRRRAESLGKIAYLDTLTQMPNRASCEWHIDLYARDKPGGDLAVFIFDMNNLKQVNDLLGHQGGDRIIADFGRILKAEGEHFGFVGRYGGDEFLAIFPDADEARARRYLTLVNEKIVSYNLMQVNDLEKISFAAGYCVDNLARADLESMIDEADRRMYEKKRQMKENREPGGGADVS